MSSSQLISPESTARRLIDEAFSQGRLEVADELIANEFVEHQAFGPRHPAGSEGVKAVIGSLHRAFSDFQLTTQEVAIVGDTVWMRNVATGTHDGPFMDHAATGRLIRIEVFDVLRVVDGRIVEHWGVADRLAVLLQIGVTSRKSPSAILVGHTDGPTALGVVDAEL